MAELNFFHSLPESDAKADLFRCCGSHEWANKVWSERPYQTIDNLLDVAHQIWMSLPVNEWIFAFGAHPRFKLY